MKTTIYCCRTSSLFRDWLLLLCIGFSCCAGSGKLWAETSLREAAAGLFTIGVGINDRVPTRRQDWPLLLAQFGAVTPENCLKPNPVQVAEGRYDFSLSDPFVDFAATHKLRVVGHCLVWAKDDRTPAWFFREGTNAAQSRAPA